METPTSNTIETPKKTANEPARIVVAVIWLQDGFTSSGHHILYNALLSGVRRKGVAVETFGAYFKSIFSVSSFALHPSAQAAALEAIKGTLQELDLLPLATIAIRTAEQIWLTIHGIGIGGMNFEKAFLQPADMALAHEQARERIETAKQFLRAMQELATVQELAK
jgi:hypothetical protein